MKAFNFGRLEGGRDFQPIEWQQGLVRPRRRLRNSPRPRPIPWPTPGPGPGLG